MPSLEIVSWNGSACCLSSKTSHLDSTPYSRLLQFTGHTSWRRAWRDLTCEEQDDYLQVIVDMKEDGIYDEFVWLHNEVAPLTHETEQFLPWHR
jgi:hypothetical protein